MDQIFIALCCMSTLWTLASMVALWRVTRRSAAAPLACGTPVSVLKPLCGVDDALEQNLGSFFTQDHPCFELVFGIEGAADPAIPVVRRLQARFPEVRSRLVVHSGGRGINPKVANLRAMIDAASHDVVLISDSNVRAPASYLSTMTDELRQPGVGLVTSLFVGRGEQTLGAALESSQLNGPVAAGVAAVNRLAGHPACVGKSMMFCHSVLRQLGGLESVASVLAEDYVIGRMFASGGHKVVLSALVVDNVCRGTSVLGFVKRQLRWNMIRIRMVPLPFALEPLTVPLTVALTAPLLGVPLAWALAWALALTALRDSLAWWRLRGARGLLRGVALGPVRDLLMLLAYISTPLFRHVRWRGRKVRVSAGTRLYAEPGSYAAPGVKWSAQ